VKAYVFIISAIILLGTSYVHAEEVDIADPEHHANPINPLSPYNPQSPLFYPDNLKQEKNEPVKSKKEIAIQKGSSEMTNADIELVLIISCSFILSVIIICFIHVFLKKKNIKKGD